MSKQSWDVLLAEDNRADIRLLREAVEVHHLPVVLHVVEDGEEAISFLDRTDADEHAPCPDLLLLDLHLPRRNGEEILGRLRESPKCGKIPVIVMTSSDSPEQRAHAEKLGVSLIFRKPSDLNSYMEIGAIMRSALQLS